jgi:hypothetical protein
MQDQPLALRTVLEEEAAALRPNGDRSRPFSALCISGGGIRSATFGLGAIQSLAERGLLTQFDYLSTVSGGGYIGSWLSAWAKRADGIENVVPRLRTDSPAPGPDELDPVQHLREYNNYLSPKLGGFSSDAWTLIATVVRNIALNWLVLIPLLLGLLMAPRVLVAIAHMSHNYSTDNPYNPYGMADSPIVVWGLPAACNLLFFFGMLHIWRYLPGIGGVNHSGADFMKRVLGPFIGATVLFCAYDAMRYWDDGHATLTIQQCLVATLVPAAASWLVFLLFYCRREEVHAQIVPLSLAIALLAVSLGSAEWLVTTKVASSRWFNWPQFVAVVPPLIGVSFFAALAIFAGLSSGQLEDKDREWLSRAGASILLVSVAWVLICVIVLIAPEWIFQYRKSGGSAVAALGTVAAWASRLNRRDEESPAGKPDWLAPVIKLAPAVFIVCLAIGLSILSNAILRVLSGGQISWSDHPHMLERSAIEVLLGAQAGFFLISSVAARYININKFSLFGMYRDRLIRAYLGASNPLRASATAQTGDGPHLFTGFAQSDNVQMQELVQRPLHVVNLTLNLVAGQRLAWQQRKAQSFTVSPLHCGNYELGYRPSSEYCGGISLGTAVTISGAAASPNMGYHSSPATGFIMTLLNARLGAWLGNPGPAGAKTWKHAGPRTAVGSLLKEAFGLTSNQSEYVYLSDGGHFENLGLYEMVLRRCKHIVVLDSGCDETFTYEDLGNALRKIRIDLRVGISFEGIDPKKRCAVARIDYGDGEPGYVVYVKPRLLQDEPPDVTSYWKGNPAFPHQTTADQWFDESQTESYRMLGKFTMDSICGSWPADGRIADLGRHVTAEYLGVRQSSAGA